MQDMNQMNQMQPQLWITNGMCIKARSIDDECARAQVNLSAAQKAYAALGEPVQHQDDERACAVARCNLMRERVQTPVALKLRQGFNRALIETFAAMCPDGQDEHWLDEALRNADKLPAQLVIQLLAEKYDLVFCGTYGEWHPRGVVAVTDVYDDDVPF